MSRGAAAAAGARSFAAGAVPGMGRGGAAGRSRLFHARHERAPVRGLIAERAGPTLLLMGTGLLLATLGGMAFGIVAAVRANSALDIALTSLAALGISSPAFLTALLGLFVFAVHLRWALTGRDHGNRPGWHQRGRRSYHLVLPAAVFGITAMMTLTMRFMRASLLEALSQDYVRTARAKGVAEFVVITKHALRNALLPVVTLAWCHDRRLKRWAATSSSRACSTGRAWDCCNLVNAVEARDYPLHGTGATPVISVRQADHQSGLTDRSYAAIDPRIRAGSDRHAMDSPPRQHRFARGHPRASAGAGQRRLPRTAEEAGGPGRCCAAAGACSIDLLFGDQSKRDRPDGAESPPPDAPRIGWAPTGGRTRCWRACAGGWPHFVDRRRQRGVRVDADRLPGRRGGSAWRRGCQCRGNASDRPGDDAASGGPVAGAGRRWWTGHRRRPSW